MDAGDKPKHGAVAKKYTTASMQELGRRRTQLPRMRVSLSTSYSL